QGGQAGPGSAATAGCRARSTRAGTTGHAPAVSTLQGGGRRGHRIDAEGAAGGHLIAYSLNAHHGRNDLEETWITHALTAEGADASEDGTGRGTPLVPVFAPLTAGTAARVGVNAAGRRREDDWNLTAAGRAVRRLTPRECERLQGFPDDWTRWLADGSEQSDSARYRELGNAVAVPVGAWITGRLAATAHAARSTIKGRPAA
ncbi:MAG TPA: DNA cytosine methyltransferase, partial [Streptosporangiaceae bacterium]